MEYTPKGITPLPYEVRNLDGCRYSIGPKGHELRFVAITAQGNDKNNAEYLVHTANEYPKAIEALRHLADWWNGNSLLGIEEIIAKADAVLAHAREIEQEAPDADR